MEDKIYCNKCNCVIEEGYIIHDGMWHYCSDGCLYSVVTKEQYEYMYKNGFAFWTTFED